MTAPYTCTGEELPGDAELFDENGIHFNTIWASHCFADWYCVNNGWTWQWRSGIDPDDPSTWPQPLDPEPEQP